MKYSIIIATYNRLEELKELISSVANFDFPKDQFELIISDDGSTDGTDKYIKNQTYDFACRYIFQENKGPGEARNHGMREAHGEYFIFIDSDCLIPSDYLAKIDRSIQENQWEAFGGPDDSHPSFSPLLKAINYSMTSFIGTGGTRGKSKSVAKFFPRSFNMGIHRKVFEKIGGMGGLRHGQDMDFSARIYRAGFKVGLIPDAVVYHKRRTNLRRFFKQIFNWGIARINLGRKYEEMLKPVHFLPASIVFLAVTVTLLSIFFPLFRQILMIGLIIAGLLGLYAFFEAMTRYKNLKIAILSIITLFTQIIAYGLGTWSGLFQSLLGKSEVKGFTKDYYK